MPKNSPVLRHSFLQIINQPLWITELSLDPEEVATENHVTKWKSKQTHVLISAWLYLFFYKLRSIKLKLIYFNVTII